MFKTRYRISAGSRKLNRFEKDLNRTTSEKYNDDFIENSGYGLKQIR